MTQETALVSALVQARRTRRRCRWVFYLTILGLLYLMWSPVIHAVGIEKVNNCAISWIEPTTGIAPDGYRLYWGSTPGARDNSFDAGASLATTCVDAGFALGQHYVVVRSYLSTGEESIDSNEVPFVFTTLDPPVLTIQ